MKLNKLANGKITVTISPQEWISIGKSAGFLKEAMPADDFDWHLHMMDVNKGKPYKPHKSYLPKPKKNRKPVPVETPRERRVCPFCSSTHSIYNREDSGKPEYRCIDCNKYFISSANHY